MNEEVEFEWNDAAIDRERGILPYYCPNCRDHFWIDKRKGHSFNGDRIECPEPPFEDDEQHND